MSKPSIQEEISGAVVLVLAPIMALLLMAMPLGFLVIVGVFIRALYTG